MYFDAHPLRVIPGLVEDMVAVATHALAAEQRREAEALGHLGLGDDVVAAFRLPNNKLADLRRVVNAESRDEKQKGRNIPVALCP